MSTCSASSKFDIRTMSRGRYWHWRTNPVWWIIFPSMGIASILFGLYSFPRAHGRPYPVILIVAGVYFVSRYWISWFQFRQALKKHPGYNSLLNWTFNEDGVELVSEHAHLKSNWNAYLKTYTVSDGFLLYPQKGIFNWIPRSGFESDQGSRILEDILARKTRNTKICGVRKR